MMNLFGETLSPKNIRPEVKAPAQLSPSWIYLGMSAQVFVMLFSLVICSIWVVNYFIHQPKDRSSYVTSPLSEAKSHSLSILLAPMDNIHEAQRELSQLAWIKSVRIKQRLDESWVLSIEENLPIAQLPGQGYFFADGSMLKEELPIESLPQLVGETEWIPRLAPIMSGLLEQLRNYDIDIRQFIIEKGGGLTLQLQYGSMLYMGSRDYEQRSARLMIFIAGHQSQLARIQSIDLRYDNAVAISWQERASSL